MPAQDTTDVRKKIVSIINRRGPSLPVHIAKEINLSILFTSVFLSELVSDKEIKISFMRVGSSPIYFVSGQESKLENFIQHLQGKEKEALALLKQKQILKDKEQEPAIRVALREIKDFAIPFKKEEEIYWKYYLIPKEELKEETKKEITEEKREKPTKEIEKQKEPGIAKKPKKKPEKKQPETNKSKQQKEEFFKRVKEFLFQKVIEILEVVDFNRKELILRVRETEKEELVVASNKKRITDDDIINASKRATELKLNYVILSFGEVPKKLRELLIATKNLSKIDKIE